MAGQGVIDGSLALAQSKCRVITIGAAEKPKDIKLRVAAYARVSSASDDQLNSFAVQNAYYTAKIESEEHWMMVDIYADEGITGTSVEKREDFKRMMSDCRCGKIDRILVKSISRFARNTKECLESIRELKSLGVSICFEKENIDTATMSGEMMTALFAAFAQAESESISGNMRWSVQKRMQAGTFLASSVPYGYRLKNRGLEIEWSEAIIVNEIFREYLAGKNRTEIAKALNARGVRTRQGSMWGEKTISYILKNERYIGNSLWQKSYPTDTLPVKRLPNRGERQQYYAMETNIPLISTDMFQQVQKLLARRKSQFVKEQNGQRRIFAQTLVCGNCGGYLRHKSVNGRDYWVCREHEANRSNCTITPIAETALAAAFCCLHFKLKKQGTSILGRMLTKLQTIRNRRMLWSLDIIELNKRISELTSQNQLLTKLKQQGLVDSDIFISQANALSEQIRTFKLEKERLQNSEQDEAIAATKELIESLEDGPDFLDDFDEELFEELIDKITIESNECLRFRLKNGLELAEKIERTVR